MVPSVELSSQTFARLQALAVPLVDNPQTVINRLIDFFEAREAHLLLFPAMAAENKIRQFSPVSPPHLTHTKVLAVEFCSRPLEHREANWNGLLNAAIRRPRPAPSPQAS